MRVALFLAVKALIRGNFGVTALTILLMALIFIDILFLPALIAGAVRTIDRQIINTVTSDLVITSSTGTGTIDNVTALLAGIRTTNGVSTATATLRVGTQISHGSESNAWSVDAIDVSTYRRVFTTPDHLIEGSYLTSADTTGILLGVDIAGAGEPHGRTYSRSLTSSKQSSTPSSERSLVSPPSPSPSPPSWTVTRCNFLTDRSLSRWMLKRLPETWWSSSSSRSSPY